MYIKQFYFRVSLVFLRKSSHLLSDIMQTDSKFNKLFNCVKSVLFNPFFK